MDVCMQCETIVCKACNEALNRFAFTDAYVHNHFSHSRHVVCTLCLANGCSNNNTQLYTCVGPCAQQLGHLRFEPARLRAHTNSRTRLCCKECVLAERAREADFKRRIKGSERVCRCQPKPHMALQHKEKCFLYMARHYMWMDKLRADDGGRSDSAWLLERMRRGDR